MNSDENNSLIFIHIKKKDYLLTIYLTAIRMSSHLLCAVQTKSNYIICHQQMANNIELGPSTNAINRCRIIINEWNQQMSHHHQRMPSTDVAVSSTNAINRCRSIINECHNRCRSIINECHQQMSHHHQRMPSTDVAASSCKRWGHSLMAPVQNQLWTNSVGNIATWIGTLWIFEMGGSPKHALVLVDDQPGESTFKG